MGKRYYLGEAGVRKLRALMNGRGESGAVRGSVPGLALEDEFAHPFTVQWAASAGESGAWLVWLPSDDLVMFGGVTIDPTEDLEDAGGDYPEGWYVLPDDALDADEGGVLYLKVSHGDEKKAEFVSSGTGGGEDVTFVPICKASVDSVSGFRSVKQFVSSTILLGSGGEGGGERYFADERSVTRCGQESTDPTQIFDTNYFHIYGFGKFTAPGYAAPIGTFQQATDLEIDPDSGESTSVAFLVRSGNSSSPDSNYIGYRKVKIGSSGRSSPFNYEKSTSTDPSTHQPVTTHKLVNCKFYWNGELQTLADFDVSGIIGGGSVYLTGKQTAPSSSDPDPDWTWQLATSEAQAPSNGKVLNFKLYDFANSKPSLDYRTTFLSLEDTTPKARIVVQKPNGQGSITLDATGDKPKLVISDGTHSINLDLSQIPETCAGGNYGLHSIQYKDKQGDTQIYHGVFCSDIDLSDLAVDGKTIERTSVSAVANGTRMVFYYTDGSSDEFVIQNGLRGKEGDKGDDGDTPVISAARNENVTNVFADGVLIAQLQDGHTPQITSSKSGKVTTIYADGVAIATIKDGDGGDDDREYERKSFISGIKFEMSGGKLKAILSKTEVSIPNWDGVRYVEYEDVETLDVCDAKEVEVVTEESYSSSSHQFTNKRKKVTVMGAVDATGQTPFTATPLSGE